VSDGKDELDAARAEFVRRGGDLESLDKNLAEQYELVFGSADPEYLEARDEAVALFQKIMDRLGKDKAIRIFRSLTEPRSKENERKLQNVILLGLYKPSWPVRSFAKLIVWLNHELARRGVPDGFGPRGSRSVDTVEKHLHRLLKKRQKK